MLINLKFISLVAILVVIFGGGILFYQYWLPSQQEVKQVGLTPVDQTSVWKAYRNEELGISFSYPERWGKVEERRYSSFSTKLLNGETVSGNQIILDFEDKAGIQLIFTSPDYKEIIRGENKEREFFKGREEQLVCGLLPADGYNDVIIIECEQTNIDNSLAMISYVAYFASGGYAYNLSKDIKIISPNQNFPGIDIWVIGIPRTSHSFGGRMNPDISLEEFANGWKKQLEGSQLPLETSQFLTEFDNFVGSIKFIK